MGKDRSIVGGRAGSAPSPARVAGFFDRRGALVVWVLIALYVAAYFSACVTKYRHYLYADFDLAIFVQATSQILRGSLFSSIRGMNWLGDHSSLILFLVAPFYAIVRSPLTLLFLQTASLGVGAWAVFLIARRELSSGLAAVAFAAVYLLHPAIGYANLYEFHPEALSTSALLFTLHYLLAGRLRPMTAWATLALLCKEDVALVMLALGAYALTLRPERRDRHAMTLAGLAAVSLVLSFAVLKPAFNLGESEYGRLYAHWGGTTWRALVAMSGHPGEVVASFFSTPGNLEETLIKRQYHLQMLLPVLFLSLFSPLTLAVALPALATHFLSWRFQQQTIVFQYTALITPFVVGSAVLGARNLARWLGAARHRGRDGRKPRSNPEALPARPDPTGLALGALGAAVLCSVLFGPLWGFGMMLRFKPTERLRPDGYERALVPYRDRMVSAVPPGAGVVAGSRFLARLAGRDQVHALHHVLLGAYTFSTRPYPLPARVDALLADMSDDGALPYIGPQSGERMQRLIRLNRLRPVQAAGDQVLLVRDARDTVELCAAGAARAAAPREVVFDAQLAFLGFDPVDAASEPGGEVTFRTCWQRTAAVDREYFMDLALLGADGQSHYARRRALGYGLFPARQWPLGTAVRETGRLIIPADLPPGVYTLAFGLAWRAPQGRGAAAPHAPVSPDGLVRLGRVNVSVPPLGR